MLLYKNLLLIENFPKCGNNVKNHNNLCIIKPQFQCLICNAYFKNMKVLKQHQICHSNNFFECTTCKQKFKRKGDLKEHNIRHEKDLKTYNCIMCEKNFTRKKDLGIRINRKYNYSVNYTNYILVKYV